MLIMVNMELFLYYSNLDFASKSIVMSDSVTEFTMAAKHSHLRKHVKYMVLHGLICGFL